jgi:hypothetical protein
MEGVLWGVGKAGMVGLRSAEVRMKKGLSGSNSGRERLKIAVPPFIQMYINGTCSHHKATNCHFFRHLDPRLRATPGGIGVQ